MTSEVLIKKYSDECARAQEAEMNRSLDRRGRPIDVNKRRIRAADVLQKILAISPLHDKQDMSDTSYNIPDMHAYIFIGIMDQIMVKRKTKLSSRIEEWLNGHLKATDYKAIFSIWQTMDGILKSLLEDCKISIDIADSWKKTMNTTLLGDVIPLSWVADKILREYDQDEDYDITSKKRNISIKYKFLFENIVLRHCKKTPNGSEHLVPRKDACIISRLIGKATIPNPNDDEKLFVDLMNPQSSFIDHKKVCRTYELICDMLDELRKGNEIDDTTHDSWCELFNLYLRYDYAKGCVMFDNEMSQLTEYMNLLYDRVAFNDFLSKARRERELQLCNESSSWSDYIMKWHTEFWLLGEDDITQDSTATQIKPIVPPQYFSGSPAFTIEDIINGSDKTKQFLNDSGLDPDNERFIELSDSPQNSQPAIPLYSSLSLPYHEKLTVNEMKGMSQSCKNYMDYMIQIAGSFKEDAKRKAIAYIKGIVSIMQEYHLDNVECFLSDDETVFVYMPIFQRMYTFLNTHSDILKAIANDCTTSTKRVLSLFRINITDKK